MYYPDESFEYFSLDKDPKDSQPTISNRPDMRLDVLTGDYVYMNNETLASSAELEPQTLEHLKSIGYPQGPKERPICEAERVPAKDSVTDGDSNNRDPEDH